MRIIYFGNSKYSLVDDDDYDHLIKFNWFCVKMGRQIYAQRNVSTKEALTIKTKSMHREIMKARPEDIIDHINGNGLDNRKQNLRFASKRLNGQNRDKPANNKSGYKGVSFRKTHKLWQATIVINGKQKHLIYSKNKKVAALAYDTAAILHFGAFAKTNFKKDV
jgi:hypothetical protein